MVVVVAWTEGVACRFVEPRVVRRDASIPVQVEPGQRVGAIAVVGDDVEDDRNAPVVALVHQFFQLLFRAVKLVDRKTVSRVVTPAQVALELAHRHELDGVEPHVLQVIQPVDDVLKRLGLVEIAHQRFIDDEAVGGRALEILVCPTKLRLHCLEHGLLPIGLPRGVRWHVRIRGRGDVLVLPRVEHQRAVGVSDFQVSVAQEVVAVLDVRIQVVQLHPVQVPVGALAHQGAVVDHEVVEVATKVNVRLAWRAQLHDGRVVVQNVHPIHGARRRVQDDGGLGTNVGQQRQGSTQGSHAAKGKR